MTVRIGAHGDVDDAASQAEAIGADIAQVFLSDPQAWKLDAAALSNPGVPAYVHAPYVINVASTNNRIRVPGRRLLQATCTAAADIGALGVVVHGGHVTASDDPAVGFENWRKAIDGLDVNIPLLIENTAGGNNAMARYLDRIALLWEHLADSPNIGTVGFTLDTCHAWAAGLNLATVVEDILVITGRIDLVHANNSRDADGSGADRHARLREGTIPPDLLVEVIGAATSHGADVILETRGTAEETASDIAWLRGELSKN
ncbi:MAG: deoxyribonuclease IV [Cellulomonadaceae bacterium]|jgi:deoxyribonuclease-4|nr:deoxyribonuclease IV [Cellulomonadaceae bacterium]